MCQKAGIIVPIVLGLFLKTMSNALFYIIWLRLGEYRYRANRQNLRTNEEEMALYF